MMAKEITDKQHTREQSTRSKDKQWHQHDHWRFMHMMHHIGRSPRLAVEGHENQPPGIETGEGRRNDQHDKGKSCSRIASDKGGLNNGILGNETGGSDRCERNTETGQRQGADNHHPIGRWNVFAQTAHATHVLFIGNSVNDRSGAKKQQSLEKRMGKQVEDTRPIGAHTQSHEHVAEL